MEGPCVFLPVDHLQGKGSPGDFLGVTEASVGVPSAGFLLHAPKLTSSSPSVMILNLPINLLIVFPGSQADTQLPPSDNIITGRNMTFSVKHTAQTSRSANDEPVSTYVEGRPVRLQSHLLCGSCRSPISQMRWSEAFQAPCS